MKKFSFSQENTELMSQELQLETIEKHQWNDFYGNAEILKKYIGLNQISLSNVIEHAVMLDDNIWHIDKNSIFKTVFVCSDFRKEVYKNSTNKYIFNIGPMINYVEIDKTKYISSGSIYFLPHSSHELKCNFNFDEIIFELNNLPIDIRPEYVCLYWKDIQYGHHNLFVEKGFKILSAGHIYDKLFLYRLKEIFLNFETIITNELGTHVFFAHQCGLNIISPSNLNYFNNSKLNRQIQLSGFYNEVNEFNLFKKLTENLDNLSKEFLEIFSDSSTFSSKEKDKFLEKYSNSIMLSKLKLKILYYFSKLVEIKKHNFILNHLTDFLYLRIDKFISNSYRE